MGDAKHDDGFFLLQGFRSSPRHARRRVAPRLEETQPLVEAHHLSEQETSVRKRKIKKSSRVQPEFYHSVQVTPTRKPVSILPLGINST